MVDAFLRGFAKCSRYGPQLDKLSYYCKYNAGAEFLHESGYIGKSLDARVIRGKVLLHGVHKLSVSLFAHLPSSLTSQVDISQIFQSGLMPAIDKFKTIGCDHTPDTLPAVILDALQLQVGCSGDRTRSLDLLNCGRCATDLRVRVELDCGGTFVHVEVKVEVWRSFGGYEPNNRDESEDAHFDNGRSRYKPFDINHPPGRNLEEMFKERVEEECGMLESPDQPRRRQSWIQLWKWSCDSRTAQLRRYCVPCEGDGVSARIQEQALPLQCAIQ